MKRRILIALLTLGTIGGYGVGFASMRCRAQARHGAFERHVAKVCVDAAREGKAAPNATAQDRPADW
jgi:hypothetical protein